MTGIPWLVSACVGLVLVGVIFSFANVVYNLLENVMTYAMGVLVIGSAVIAAIVGSFNDLVHTFTGMVSFGYLPHTLMTATWFPVLVGSIAFAGPSGMQQMWYSLWLRDKGAGMGAHLPKIRGLTHAAEEETIPSRGFMFDTESPREQKKWKDWQRWVKVDAIVLFWGITMLVTIIYTVLAQAAATQSPHVKTLIANDSDSALTAMSNAFSSAGGPIVGGLFFGFIALVGFKGSLGIFDAFARGQADMTHFFIPGAKRFKMSHLYFAFLWGVLIFGILILLFGPADGPTSILNTLAFLSAFVMGAYCIVLLLVNNKLLPRRIKPGIVTNLVLGFGACFYLGALFYCILKFGWASIANM
jgi:hypothetical protein